MKGDFSDKYQPIQWFIVTVSIVVCIIVISTEDQSSLYFLNYVNLFSLIATLIMLTLVLYKVTLATTAILVTDRKKHAKHFYITFWILVVVLLPSVFLYSYFNSIPDKVNNVLGIMALALALSTDAISERILELKLKKDKKKYNSMY
ncbi:hypothetical protein GCM10008014_24900 [Paenibacillus silvae]|uniref:Uncharacterized protein n=1 Tax=Paenibacillus silvae TaxID=1325358 RepID=A0ABQ1ZBT1_9BACL|nr:hypothetical protein [Paenibacillus silvae]GGH55359.1 hypothetical protein GCM10008014_24900 [Paenibacillus silvae]